MTSPTPELSIIIPCYNVAPWLGRCLESILPQCRPGETEIITVNDGSTDSTLGILRGYAARYPEIVRLIDQPNGGVSSARNAGIDAATGRYITFVDADDEILPFNVAETISTADADIMVAPYVDRYPSGIESTNFYENCDGTYLDFLKKNLFATSPCAKFYKTDLLTLNNIRFDTGMKWCEDADFIYRLSHIATSVAILPTPNYVYIHRDGSAIKKFYGYDLPGWIDNLLNQRREIIKGDEDKDSVIERDAAFNYLMGIYSIYRTARIKDRRNLLKFYISHLNASMVDPYKYLDSGIPKICSILFRKSSMAAHLFLSLIFKTKRLLSI